MTSTPTNLLTEWATLLLGSLADAGITDVVISPGSRSTPFVVAAARNSRLRCYDAMDERGAAFFALGLTRITGRPSLLICTSGTAGAHYLPAVIEAACSYTPLLILTADRPLELQQCGASQTIDQIKLFGDHARGFFELGAADASHGALRSVRRIAAQAVALSQWPTPGAVHINGRARKPLEPVPARTADELDLSNSVARLLAAPITAMCWPESSLDARGLETAARTIRSASRGIIVAGPAPAQQCAAREALFQLAMNAGFPILAETTSQLRFAGERPAGCVVVDAFDTILRSAEFRRAARPDLIVQLGGFPVSTGFERFCSEYLDVPNLVLAPHGWHDPFNRATVHLVADVHHAVRQLADHLGPREVGATSPWLELCRALDRESARVAARVAEPEGDVLNEAGAARAMVRAAPHRSALLLGNSNAIRLVDTFAPSEPKDLVVLSQRGAAGIDGLISGAAGSVRAGNRPVGLLIGDVSFFHDVSGLALAAGVEHQPLVIVVVQNHGGRIFDQLPIAAAGIERRVLEHITTPHQLEVEPTVRGFRLRYARAETRTQLGHALSHAYRTRGCTVIEAVVPDNGAARLFETMWTETNAAVAPVLAAE
jgi:2-succinyl-5-enolpyruvyl-6-hydroxy-3-cyclohexene-1-carboxylate synthase